MGFSHTPYMSLDMTHTTKITLSISPIDTTFVAVSFSSPSQTDIIHLFTDQTNSPCSLSLTHISCFHSPSRLSSLSHTHKTLAFAPRLIFLSHNWSTSLQIGLYTRILVPPLSRTCLSRAPCIYVDFSSLLETRPLNRAHTHTIASF